MKKITAHILLMALAPSTALATQSARLPDSTLTDVLDPRQDDGLGTRVRGHGQFVLASSQSDLTPGNPCNGSVNVFRRGPNGYEHIQRISPPVRDGCWAWTYAWEIDVCGDYLFVCAGGMNLETQTEGGVFVYRRTPNGYVFSQLINRPPGWVPYDALGRSIDVEGDRVYISANRPAVPIDFFMPRRRGAVYIYREQGGTWVLEDWFEGEDTPQSTRQAGSQMGVADGRVFGRSSSYTRFFHEKVNGTWVLSGPFFSNSSVDGSLIDGGNGWLIIGDPVVASGSFAEPGFVRVFRWNGTEYEPFQDLAPAVRSQVPGAGDQFGSSVHLRGDELLIGAAGRARNGVSSVGGAYVFRLEGGQWVEKEVLLPRESTLELSVVAGNSVHIADGAYLVGAQFLVENGIRTGGVYVYDRAFGEPLCDGLPNSMGGPATLNAYGTTAASAAALELRATGLPVSTFTLLATGQGAALTPFLGGGQGTLCIAAQGIRRLDVLQADAQGESSWQVDFDTLPGTPLPGQTYHFQAWYRDQDPGPTSNLSDAVSVLLK